MLTRGPGSLSLSCVMHESMRIMALLTNAYSTLWRSPLVNGCTQPLSNNLNIKFEFHRCLPYIIMPLKGNSTNWSLSLYTIDYNQNRSKDESRNIHKITTQQQHAHKQKEKSTWIIICVWIDPVAHLRCSWLCLWNPGVTISNRAAKRSLRVFIRDLSKVWIVEHDRAK